MFTKKYDSEFDNDWEYYLDYQYDSEFDNDSDNYDYFNNGWG